MHCPDCCLKKSGTVQERLLFRKEFIGWDFKGSQYSLRPQKGSKVVIKGSF